MPGVAGTNFGSHRGFRLRLLASVVNSITLHGRAPIWSNALERWTLSQRSYRKNAITYKSCVRHLRMWHMLSADAGAVWIWEETNTNKWKKVVKKLTTKEFGRGSPNNKKWCFKYWPLKKPNGLTEHMARYIFTWHNCLWNIVISGHFYRRWVLEFFARTAFKDAIRSAISRRFPRPNRGREVPHIQNYSKFISAVAINIPIHPTETDYKRNVATCFISSRSWTYQNYVKIYKTTKAPPPRSSAYIYCL